MSKIKRSLSLKLSLGIVLLAAPTFVLALGILFLQSRYFIRQEATERATSMLSLTIQRVRNYMSAVETSTNSNTWLIEENFNPDSLLAISHRIVRLNRHAQSCSISVEPGSFPQYGRYFSVYAVNEGDTIISVRETEYDYFEKFWYRNPVDSGKACWVDPFYEHSEGLIDQNEAFATYCKPFYQKGGKVAGVISVDLSFSKLAETISSTNQTYPNAYFMLLRGDGRYFIHPDTTRLFRKTIFNEADPNEHADWIALGYEMTAGKQGNAHIIVNHQVCHVCYGPVPGTNWSLALICPDGDILKNYHELIYIIIALIVIGLLIILWLCNRVVSQAILPLNQLLNMSQKIADGHHEEVIPISNRLDVIGQLQNSFAMMQESLQIHMGSIRQTTKETQKRNEELVRAMKMAEVAVKQKTLFIQNVSHQIRTPLNIIQGFANVLRDSLSPSEKEKNALSEEELANITEMMKHNASHLNRMVLMLYDSSEIGTSKEVLSHRNDQVSCNELSRECISFTYSHFPNLSIRFETELSDAECIQTNHLYLMRTLRELLYNSAKYSDGKHITLYVSQTETTIRFIVEDVGPGLPKDLQDLIFKPFIKVDDLSEGLGLGLPLSKRHAISLGGDLLFDTTYTKGCRAIIEIPK